MDHRRSLAYGASAALLLITGSAALAATSGVSRGATSNEAFASGGEGASASNPGAVEVVTDVVQLIRVEPTAALPRPAANKASAPESTAEEPITDTPGGSSTTDSPPTTAASSKGGGPTSAPQTTTAVTTAPATVTTSTSAPSPTAPVTAPALATTTTRATTTTTRRRTTTTRQPGVPADWPADKPIPPMPPNCRDPQLEDNGVWNCDD